MTVTRRDNYANPFVNVAWSSPGGEGKDCPSLEITPEPWPRAAAVGPGQLSLAAAPAGARTAGCGCRSLGRAWAGRLPHRCAASGAAVAPHCLTQSAVPAEARPWAARTSAGLRGTRHTLMSYLSASNTRPMGTSQADHDADVLVLGPGLPRQDELIAAAQKRPCFQALPSGFGRIPRSKGATCCPWVLISRAMICSDPGDLTT